MPCFKITLPRQNPQIYRSLAKELTSAFCQATKHPEEIFGVRFFPFAPGLAFSGGEVSSENPKERPYIHFLLYCPNQSRATKQKLSRNLCDAFTRVLQKPHWTPVIHICEHSFDHVSIEGQLLSDLFEECKS